MKLELKHYSAYLPYNLNLFDTFSNKKFSRVLCGVSLDYLISSDNQNIKPILRPLSDLTKEIQILENYKTFYEHLYDSFSEDGFDFQYLETSPLKFPYEVVQKLLEWKFDIYGLIENNLAIDINTLK